METYESSVKKVYATAEDIYRVVSDMNNVAKMKNMIPVSMKEQYGDKLKVLETMECDDNSVTFEAPMVGRMGIVIVEREENKVVKFGGNPSPCEFNFWIQMKQVNETESAIKLTLKADLPFMIKMMVGSKLKDGIEKLAEMMAKVDYSRLGQTLV
ncbi:MAG: SRPBCC family protein [Paludibacteraceae bacterium]|nr:SRPBCC family protein [Paludibacteraceae bacterium]